MVFTTSSPNSFLGVPSSKIIIGCASNTSASKTPDALLKTTKPEIVPIQILLSASEARLNTFKFGKLPCVGVAVNPLILFPFSLNAITPSPRVPIQIVLFLSVTISESPNDPFGFPSLISNSDQDPFESFFNSLETPILVSHKLPRESNVDPEIRMVTMLGSVARISSKGLFKLL